MTSSNRTMIPVLLVSFLTAFAPESQAQNTHPRVCGSYGEIVGHKALNAFGNLGGSVLELPKNVINTSNQSNVFYGFTGGLFKGIVNMAGRIGVGVADLVTIPLPTKPIAYPLYVWDDFDIDTTYGEAYRLYQCTPKPKPIVQATEPEPVIEPEPAIYTPQPLETPEVYQDTTRKIDRLFKEEMHK